MNNTQDKLIKQWAADMGSNAKRVFADNIDLIQATCIATNLLKHDAKLLEQNQVHTLQTFLQAAQSKDRNKITQGQCFKIMNIGTQINRKLFKQVKAHK
jgi:septum formation inhibitor-activating ATPase MinD